MLSSTFFFLPSHSSPLTFTHINILNKTYRYHRLVLVLLLLLLLLLLAPAPMVLLLVPPLELCLSEGSGGDSDRMGIRVIRDAEGRESGSPKGAVPEKERCIEAEDCGRVAVGLTRRPVSPGVGASAAGGSDAPIPAAIGEAAVPRALVFDSIDTSPGEASGERRWCLSLSAPAASRCPCTTTDGESEWLVGVCGRDERVRAALPPVQWYEDNGTAGELQPANENISATLTPSLVVVGASPPARGPALESKLRFIAVAVSVSVLAFVLLLLVPLTTVRALVVDGSLTSELPLCSDDWSSLACLWLIDAAKGVMTRMLTPAPSP